MFVTATEFKRGIAGSLGWKFNMVTSTTARNIEPLGGYRDTQ